MNITYATGNLGKVMSLRGALDGLPVNVREQDLNLTELDSPNIISVALAKAEDAYKLLSQPVIVNDSGFFLKARPNYPANKVRREVERIGLEGFLEIVEGKDRSGEFFECLAYIDGQRASPEYFADRISGTIAEEIRGEEREHHWSPLARIFIPDGWNKTLAEMTKEEHKERRAQNRESKPEHQFRKWFEETYKSEIAYNQWSDGVQCRPYPKK